MPITGASGALLASSGGSNAIIANVKSFGAQANGSDDSAAIQEAIDTGLPVVFPDGLYRARNLVQSVDYQQLIGIGNARLQKNASGVLFASSGRGVECHNLGFYGGTSATPEFTGDNVTFSGDSCALVGCFSMWAAGRAAKATGNHFQIDRTGKGGIYQTADVTATGYDIEIGLSGIATLYHELWGVYSSQGTGGILLIDTGAHTIVGGEFGKLRIGAGTQPAGTGGGKTIGARIKGDITIELPSTLLTGNQFSNIIITFAATSNGCRMDQSNTYENGHTIINNGNANNLIVRQVSTGSTIQLKYGADASAYVVTMAPDANPRTTFPDDVKIPNNKKFRVQTAAAGDGAFFLVNASDDADLQNPVTNKSISYTTTGTGSGSRHQFNVGGSPKACVDNNGIVLGASGTSNLRSGAGTPEGAVTAPVGSIFVRTDGGAATTLYIKESGVGNTGWIAK